MTIWCTYHTYIKDGYFNITNGHSNIFHYYITELTVTEMRAAYEKDKARAVSEARRTAQVELEAAVKATKAKQWLVTNIETYTIIIIIQQGFIVCYYGNKNVK